MKILPIEKIREADAYTIEHEPIEDIDLMERAAGRLREWFIKHIDKNRNVMIFCGAGNNGGDGFALGRMLAGDGYRVDIVAVWYSGKLSPSCKINYDRAVKKKIGMTDLKPDDKLPEIKNEPVVVDALFGSGLSRPVKGFPARVIDHINQSEATIISIDAPSGLFCDETNTGHKGSIIHACNTLTFQFPKLGFVFPENHPYVGDWEVLDIGLHPEYIRNVEVKNHYLQMNDLRPVIKKRSKFDHKGVYGHGLLISGGYGKMGAAVLAASAGLRSGAGLISAHIPRKGYQILQTAVPEAMVSIDENDDQFTGLKDMDPYNAIAVGPGIGTSEETARALKLLIQNSALPVLFDADAINILGENKTWIPFVPKLSIFTPHPKEFERLAGHAADNFERNRMQREFSIKYTSYVVLKGAHTAVTCPDGSCYFNSTGNPGMATGGSGDVLTGILLGLLASGYKPKEACLLGVYLHGLAADLAAESTGYEALIAGDIIRNLPGAFKQISGTSE